MDLHAIEQTQFRGQRRAGPKRRTRDTVIVATQRGSFWCRSDGVKLNHSGIRRLAQTRRDCRFYALETAPHYRRYIGALDVACAAVRARFDPRPCGPGVLEAPRRWRDTVDA